MEGDISASKGFNIVPKEVAAVSTQQWWQGDLAGVDFKASAMQSALEDFTRPVFVVNVDGRIGITQEGNATIGKITEKDSQPIPLMGLAPSLRPNDLGDSSFQKDHGLQYCYVVGAMANGITSVEMVRAAGQAGMIGFFGAGGLSLDQVERAINKIQSTEEIYPYGFNLIHSPNDPQLEAAVVELYLKRNVVKVSASAFMGLTLPLLHYRYQGIHQSPDGQIICPNHVFAKVSRVEVARKFFSPPPEALMQQLVLQGKLTVQEAHLAHYIPVAQDMTAEADSGGHTDNRPALTLLPIFLSLRDESQTSYGFKMPLRVGLAGGIATPSAAAAAFAMGAAYVLTGSVNQSCIEADTSEIVRQMLIQAQQADVTMAPAADMFELGAKVQVLKRGTMFAMRGAKLYEMYRTYDDYHQIPESTRRSIERDILQSSFEQAWLDTCAYFQQRDSEQIQRGEKDPKHKMALVFRSYLGLSSVWAKNGLENRVIDFQIWCGPAMGAFNAWVKGTFLEKAAERKIATVGMNLLFGATVLMRAQWLRCQGIHVRHDIVAPLPLDRINKKMMV